MHQIALMGAAMALSMSSTAAAQERVPIVAAGMEWGVDPESCQVVTPVEGNSMYESLTLNSYGIGNDVAVYELMTDDRDLMKMPKQVTMLANGSEPLPLGVEVPKYGPVGAIWFGANGEGASPTDYLERGETVMLFTVFEMISLSPFGFKKAQEQRRECLRTALAGVGIDIEEFAASTGGGTLSKGDVRGVFTSNDYPSKALRNLEQGTVRATLVIDDEGKPRKCLVYRSSGSKLLDDTTCDVMLARTKFEPARDANGMPVQSLYTTPPIRWEIPLR